MFRWDFQFDSLLLKCMTYFNIWMEIRHFDCFIGVVIILSNLCLYLYIFLSQFLCINLFWDKFLRLIEFFYCLLDFLRLNYTWSLFLIFWKNNIFCIIVFLDFFLYFCYLIYRTETTILCWTIIPNQYWMPMLIINEYLFYFNVNN